MRWSRCGLCATSCVCCWENKQRPEHKFRSEFLSECRSGIPVIGKLSGIHLPGIGKLQKMDGLHNGIELANTFDFLLFQKILDEF